ncbi:hypothetical protein Pdw03_8844 [Penicillium digitatum]|uniref:Uncharacterized protein n=1 Tax=Penicillium digitatum TaxID=36651 RepID=A0A7T6XPC9_PENDI|nr:hypothetical protein Pdw03_8844 [Penicillium digitatum]
MKPLVPKAVQEPFTRSRVVPDRRNSCYRGPEVVLRGIVDQPSSFNIGSLPINTPSKSHCVAENKHVYC